MRHFGAVVFALTHADAESNCGFAVIVPLPLFTVESRLPEDCINHLRVIPGAKSNQCTKGGIGFGMRTIVGNVPILKEFSEFISVLLFAQIAYEVKGNLVSVTAFAVFLLFGSAHIFVKRRKNRIGAFLERLLPHHIPGEYGKTICKTANVKLQTIVGVLYVKCTVELFLTFLIGNKRQLASVALPVNMDTATADRTLRIGIEAFKKQ